MFSCFVDCPSAHSCLRSSICLVFWHVFSVLFSPILLYYFCFLLNEKQPQNGRLFVLFEFDTVAPFDIRMLSTQAFASTAERIICFWEQTLGEKLKIEMQVLLENAVIADSPFFPPAVEAFGETKETQASSRGNAEGQEIPALGVSIRCDSSTALLINAFVVLFFERFIYFYFLFSPLFAVCITSVLGIDCRSFASGDCR